MGLNETSAHVECEFVFAATIDSSFCLKGVRSTTVFVPEPYRTLTTALSDQDTLLFLHFFVCFFNDFGHHRVNRGVGSLNSYMRPSEEEDNHELLFFTG